MRLRIGTIPRVRLKDARALRDDLISCPGFRRRSLMAYLTLVGGDFGVVVKHPVGEPLSLPCEVDGVPVRVQEMAIRRPSR